MRRLRKNVSRPACPASIDTERRTSRRPSTFYGGLFGWSYKEVPPGAPRFALAHAGRLDVAGIGAAHGAPAAWNTYVARRERGRDRR